MITFSKRLDRFPWQWHLIYWLANVMLWVFFILISTGEFIEPLTNKLCYLPSQLMVTYALLYILLPMLLDGQLIRFVLTLIPVTYVATVFARFTKIYIYESIMGHDSAKEPLIELVTQLPPLLIQYLVWVFLTPALTIMMVLIWNHLKEKEELQQLKNEKKNAELRFLKAQVHPHFLFNTLNNLYALSIQNAPKTSDIAGKLYNILHYMFYKCDNGPVPISEEINLIKNYIELERIRYSNRLTVNFDIDVMDKNYRIAPLMLLTLVENAFKHGASIDKDNPKIEIVLKQSSETFSFKVYNTKSKQVATDETGYRKGIGQKNLKRQLDLLYPDQYNLSIQNTDELYEVRLSLTKELIAGNLNDLPMLAN